MKTPSDSENSNRKNVLLAVVAIILIVILCGIYFSRQKTSKPVNSPHIERSARKVNKVFTDARGDQTSSANEKLLEKFNNVKFGDLKNDGLGGTTYTQIKEIFNSGPSRKVAPSKLAGVSVKFLGWVYDDMTITFFFVKNRVVGSDISRFRWKRRKTTFDRASFKKLKNGADKNAIFKKFGKSDEVNQIKFRGKNKAIYMWFTGIKGKKGAFVSLSFTNNKLTGKAKSGF